MKEEKKHNLSTAVGVALGLGTAYLAVRLLKLEKNEKYISYGILGLVGYFYGKSNPSLLSYSKTEIKK